MIYSVSAEGMDLLKILIKERIGSVNDLATLLGCTQANIYHKMKNDAFLLRDVREIRKYLALTEEELIACFFVENKIK